MNPTTHMRREIAEIPEAAARFLDGGRVGAEAAAALLREVDPLMVATLARGSSDHAAAYLKYSIELVLGLPVASIGPSIASIYRRPLRLGRAAVLAISQSGQSPDLLAAATAARAGGGALIALTNTPGSPLAAAAVRSIDLCAGAERSVAATKSFVNSVLGGLALLAAWSEDEELRRALLRLPEVFAAALRCDWTPLADALADADQLYVLGRGPGLAIANEVALKFKETCALHAEAFSAAEVAHGPKAIVRAGYPVLVLASRDAAEASVIEMADRLVGQGATAFATSATPGQARALPFAASGHPITDALSLAVTFYAFVEGLARRRGLDPDNPPHLRKVTETR